MQVVGGTWSSRRARWVVSILVAFQCASIATASPASAAPTCSFVSGTLTVTDDGAGLDSIDVWQDTNGTAFAAVGPLPSLTAPGTFCGGGIALSSIDAIHITGGTGLTLLTIWMSQTPAATPPTAPSYIGGPGASWGTIDWIVDLSSNVFSTGEPAALLFVGTFGILNGSLTDPMSVTIGDDGVDLDSDGRLDITTIGVTSFSLSTADNTGSTLSGAGSDATGGPFAGMLIERGGAGDDVLTGGSEFDLIVGGPGRDSVDAGAGRDYVLGGRGNDWIHGGDGGDTIAGGKGNDVIEGDEGRDRCAGGTGDDVVHCEVAT
jgi:hypothetical protein